MHLYLLTRGIKHDVDRFINDLQAQYFPMDYNGSPIFAQLGVRPVQLLEIIFPKEHLQCVMNTLWDGAISARHEFKMPLSILRRTLKLKKIPELDTTVLKRIVYKTNVGIHPIGIKEDEVKHESL